MRIGLKMIYRYLFNMFLRLQYDIRGYNKSEYIISEIFSMIHVLNAIFMNYKHEL